MRKYIYLVCAMLLGVFASCSQSETGDETPQSNQVILKAIPDAGLQSRAAATGVDRFAIEVYTDATYTTPANIFADGTNKSQNTTGEFVMVLDRTQPYYCLLWADKAGATVYNLTSLKAVALTGKAVEAWQGTKTIEAGTTSALAVSLKRAVAKISLMETGKLKAGTLKLNFSQPTTFNVVDGTTTGSAVRPEETVTIAATVDGSTTAAKLNTNNIFVLSPIATANLTDLTFQYESEDEFTITQAPLKANFNTNIKGHYTTTANAAFTATCDDAWETVENDEELPTPEAKLTWAAGNLVADGANGAKIGTATDGGLFFQFGSLIGWSTTDPLAVVVKPAAFTGKEDWTETGKIWQGTTGTVPSTVKDSGSDDEKAGIGDPCHYYLGGTWRLPTKDEYEELFKDGGYPNGTWKWENSSATNKTLNLTFPALGSRSSFGGLQGVGTDCYYWSASVPSNVAGYGYNQTFDSSSVASRASNRAGGMLVRCVHD